MASNEFVSKEAAKRFGDDYIKIIIKELKKVGKSASGRLINSFDERIQSQAKGVNIAILSEDYLTYVDEGRKRGKYPPISAISKWASLKGISQSAVFPIAKSIYKFGIKPTNVIQKADNKFLNSRAIGFLEDDIAENVEDMIVEDFNKGLNKIGNN